MSKTKCQLEREPFYQCCCVCRCHINIFDNDFNPTKKWVCTLPMEIEKDKPGSGANVFLECPEHSCGCECWSDKRNIKEKETK